MSATLKSKKAKLEALALAHWDYVAEIINAHTGMEKDGKDYIVCKHHYTTAFIHGYKHGVADSSAKGNKWRK